MKRLMKKVALTCSGKVENNQYFFMCSEKLLICLFPFSEYLRYILPFTSYNQQE